MGDTGAPRRWVGFLYCSTMTGRSKGEPIPTPDERPSLSVQCTYTDPVRLGRRFLEFDRVINSGSGTLSGPGETPRRYVEHVHVPILTGSSCRASCRPIRPTRLGSNPESASLPPVPPSHLFDEGGVGIEGQVGKIIQGEPPEVHGVRARCGIAAYDSTGEPDAYAELERVVEVGGHEYGIPHLDDQTRLLQ